MQGVKREESCSRRLRQGNNNDNEDDTNVVSRLLSSDLVEQSGDDMRDGKGGVWLQRRRQGRMLESAWLRC
jgi:hypothetical protein